MMTDNIDSAWILSWALDFLLYMYYLIESTQLHCEGWLLPLFPFGRWEKPKLPGRDAARAQPHN